MLFVDSADKAARFIWTCNAFNIPLLFLADVPGLHDRHAGRAPGHHPPRREDDLRRLARRPCRRSRVIVRKAYGAGLYAMAGPAFDPGLHARAADGQDRRDGAERRGQRGLLQPAAGDRGPRGARGAPARS